MTLQNNILLIAKIATATIAIPFVLVRYWLLRQPDAVRTQAQYRLCGIVMWLGALVSIAGAISGFSSPHVVISLMLATNGLLLVTNMQLQRKKLARQLAENTGEKIL